MTYRDDLAAAQAQNEELRRELDEARLRIEELEAEKLATLTGSKAQAELAFAPPSAPARVLAGRVYYDPPRTYFPLIHILRAAAGAAWTLRPATKPPDSDSLVIVAAWHVLWRPFVYLAWLPVYVATLALLALPVATIVVTVLSALLLPVVVLARLRIGDVPIATGDGWPQGDPEEDEAAMLLWSLMAITMPVLLPVFIPLLTAPAKLGSRSE